MNSYATIHFTDTKNNIHEMYVDLCRLVIEKISNNVNNKEYTMYVLRICGTQVMYYITEDSYKKMSSELEDLGR